MLKLRVCDSSSRKLLELPVTDSLALRTYACNALGPSITRQKTLFSQQVAFLLSFFFLCSLFSRFSTGLGQDYENHRTDVKLSAKRLG